MKLFQIYSFIFSYFCIFIKYLSYITLIHSMYTSCYLYGFRNRILSNNLIKTTHKRSPLRVNFSFVSNIKTHFDGKSQNLLNTISETEISQKTQTLKDIIPQFISPLSNESQSISETIDFIDSVKPLNNNIYEQYRDMARSNYAIARIPEHGDKLYLTVFWNNNKLKMEREKNETIGVTLARLKRSLGKLDSPRNQKGKRSNLEDMPEYSVSFLTNLFKTFDENSTCEDTILRSSFISINDNLLKLFTNVPKLEKVKLLYTSMVDCPVSVMIKDEEDKLYSHVFVEWLDSEGNSLGDNLMFIPNLSDLGKNIKVRVTNLLMKYDVFESNLSRVDLAPYCQWQLERIHRFNTAPKYPVTGPLQDQNNDVRVVSFNILSPTYLSSTDSASNFFPYCPTEYIDYNYRNQLIGREINYLNPQILCLQEVSAKVYSEYLEFLFSHKYHSWFTMKGGNAGEGCAMFVNKNNYEPLEMKGMYFKDAMKAEEYQPVIRRLCTNWMFFKENYFEKYHTIYQFGLYRIKNNGKYLFLANTHLYFHPMAGHIRLLQTYVLLNELEKFKQEVSRKLGFDVNNDSYTLICGDFNSFPNESIYNFITNGFISYNHPDWKKGETFVYDKNFIISQSLERYKDNFSQFDQPFGSDNYLIVENYQGYSDSYGKNQLPFTNYCEIFNGTLDYIFHSNNVQVKRNMPGITAEEASEHVGLPSVLYPSDHLSIAADF